MITFKLRNTSFNNFRYYKRILLLLIASLVLSCGSDDVNNMEEPINLPPVINGEIDVSFGIEGVTLNWNAATDPENDEITQYLIFGYSRDIGSSNDYLSQFSAVPTTTTYSKVLPPDKSYKIEIKAQDINGNISENPLVVEFDYVNTGPTAVTGINIIKDASNVTINWDPSTDPDNNTIEYHIDWYEFNYQFTDSPILKDNFITTNTSITLSNLDQAIKYWVVITAVEQTPFAYESESIRSYFAILPPGDTYFGDIILRDQGDVDIFEGHTYTTIEGNISASPPGEGYGFHVGITDFSAFEGLQIITGNLSFSKANNDYSHGFVSFNGFHDVHTIGGSLSIGDTYLENVTINSFPIKNLSDFSSLLSVGNLNLSSNIQGLTGEFPLLETIHGDMNIGGNGYAPWENIPPYEFGFPSLETIEGSLSIGANYHIIKINHLENISTIGENFTIHHLGGVEDMSSLVTVGGNFRIYGLYDVSTQNIYPNLNDIGGDLKLENVDASGMFSLDNLNSIGGSFIYDNSNLTQQLNLTLSLANLNTIAEEIYIEGSLFNNLNFLNGISSISDLTLIGNTNLTDILSFNSLESLIIEDNDGLTSLDFTNLSFLNSSSFEVSIHNNDALMTLELGNSSAPNNSIAQVKISENDVLSSINGLNGFNQFSSLEIIENPLLVNISAFENLNIIENCLQIYNNDDLTNLNFLSNLNTINCGDVCLEIFGNGSTSSTNNLVIKGNFNLGDYCGLTDFFTNNGLCFEEYSILENGFNPTHLDIINGNCSN
jgi:hypothetical protein